MTKEDILLMDPGVELNAMVAEEVMGHVILSDKTLGLMERLVYEGKTVWGNLQAYSEDLAIAEMVVNKMLELGFGDAVYWTGFGQGRYTKAEAICKAALLAKIGGKAECNKSDQ